MAGMNRTASILRVREDGQPIEFTFEEILRFHGHHSPAGVAHAFKVMERAFPLLDADQPVERREVEIVTAFRGDGARDAFEAVTRAVTGQRYHLDPGLQDPGRGPMVGTFVFGLGYRGRAIRLRLRPGHLSDEFVELVGKPEPSEAERDRLRRLKLEMTARLMTQDATAIYEQV